MSTKNQIAKDRKTVLATVLLVGWLFSAFGANGLPSARALQGTAASLSGWFSIIRGDRANGSIAPDEFYLVADNGQATLLLLNDEVAKAIGGVLALDRKHITVRGGWINSTNAQGISVAFQVTAIVPLQGASPADSDVLSAVSGSQSWITIMCKFADVSAEPNTLAYFQGMYTSLYPGLDHYWRESSYDAINTIGSTATGWYTLPQPRSYYVYGGAFDRVRGANDCSTVANPAVNFANFAGINFIFNDELDGFAWGGGLFMTLDGVSKFWNMTWDPPWAYGNVAVMEHEMGHGFGLPHSSGAYGLTYDNQWDVMSDTWSNCSRSTDVTYGCLGQHTIAYHKDLLGWIPAPQKYTPAWGSSVTISLEQLALPQSSNFKTAQIPIDGSSTHFYTVEARRQIGYDYKLPGQGIIIHEVDITRGIPAHVVDIDGNGDTGDAGAIWSVGEVFHNDASSITVAVLSATATGFHVQINLGPSPLYHITGNAGAVNTTVSYTSGSTTTDSNGNYSITVPTGWSGTVTPSSPCFIFTPISRDYSNVTSNIPDQNYTATATGMCVSSTFPSSDLYDGWILESSETSGLGDTMNKTAAIIRLGDDAANKQYRSILSFDTSTLPDNAVVTSVTLKFKYAGKAGTLPFNTHGNLVADVRKGAFKGLSTLQRADFNAKASKSKVLTFTNSKADNWYSQSFNSGNIQYINLMGVTQFRLRFTKDDNNDFGADFLKIYSGNAIAADRPQLIIEYYVP